ncbi:sirohydrochlorin chelatase [Coleofasciculus sp. FACHB-T130]|uniref:sirohydrochlorin chelatase n=1 Tax=Cyanophyceae TaxID=3028117 RepID=UPI001689AE13|nr:sirohydrochlorin chelatase [Coleofasciculus sp. FACHB-T130]MBD1881716.1 sirohydrochlorin chelatase [Coleofasciculus sp. FACHB-T130]
MPKSSAYLLVSHGSRDPRPQAAVEQLAALIYEKAQRSEIAWVQASQPVRRLGASPMLETRNFTSLQEPLVGTAVLELATQPLHEQIRQFGVRVASAKQNRAVASEYQSESPCIQVMPLFLLPGVHVMEDIPEEVAIAQVAFGSKFKLDIRPHLGTHLGLSRLLASQFASITADARILLAHGSRRAGGNQSVETIARTLDAVPAYWSVPPSLEDRVKALVEAGKEKIAILPYFLFAGGITDAIARTVERLSQQFPSAKLQMAEPIGASAELADLIWDLRSQ